MEKRLERVNRLIKEELSRIILKEFDFPLDVLITLTRVETTNNLIQAKVYISVMPEKKTKDILQMLNRGIYELQQKLNKRLNMRPVPRIYFREEKRNSKSRQN